LSPWSISDARGSANQCSGTYSTLHRIALHVIAFRLADGATYTAVQNALLAVGNGEFVVVVVRPAAAASACCARQKWLLL
jgi:hypothetical protein